MNTISRSLAAIVAGLFLSTFAIAADSPSELLQRGEQLEDSNAAAAARVYQQIVDAAEADRSAQAEAHYRLAMHFIREKQRTQAADVLNRLIRNYPEQTRWVNRARTELGNVAPADPSAPPAVVSTTPQWLQNDVDPDLGHIEITFDRPMNPDAIGFTGAGESYPDPAGKPSFDATRTTCTLPVKLRPGRVYWIGINGPTTRGFAAEDGTPAQWRILLFSTRTMDGKPTPIPLDRQRRAKQINEGATRPEAPPARKER